MYTLYFGPEKNVPSWFWVGKDIGEHLKLSHEVLFFRQIKYIQNDSIVYWIKSPPRGKDLNLIKQKNLKIIYFPIDYYNSESDIKADDEFISYTKLIVLHSNSLNQFFTNKNIAYIDHYNKYGIDFKSRSPQKNILWIGGYQYFPYILFFIKKNNIKYPITILSDINNPSAKNAACNINKKLNLSYNFNRIKNFDNIKFIEWSEFEQKEQLKICAAAFDYKYVNDFNQEHKPPTKIQKYFCSYIPSAINKESLSYSYIKNYGFEMCDPADYDKLLSKKYLEDIISFGSLIKNQLSIDTIAKKYLEFAKWV